MFRFTTPERRYEGHALTVELSFTIGPTTCREIKLKSLTILSSRLLFLSLAFFSILNDWWSDMIDGSCPAQIIL